LPNAAPLSAVLIDDASASRFVVIAPIVVSYCA